MRQSHFLAILPMLAFLFLAMLMACGYAQGDQHPWQASADQAAGKKATASQVVIKDAGQDGEPYFDLAGELSAISWLNDEERIDLQCLRQSYPAINGLVRGNDSCLYLVLADGRRLVYRRQGSCRAMILEADIATSMAQPYPLETLRPETPAGVAPGRQRSRELLTAIYGQPDRIGRSLHPVSLLGRRIFLTGPAAAAFVPVAQKLQAMLQSRPELARWLRSDGGYIYRKIAGEDRISPHSYGIALDLSAHLTAYWRWSRQRPHPQQASYPTEIVSAFEDAGFIWGGKWHEYDIMHFEYRPEIICKSRIQTSRKASQNQE